MISTVQQLMEKGVKVHCPETVDLGPDVNLDRISGDGVVIYPGCRIYGSSTLILQGAKLGYEGPVTIEDCYIAPRVQLNGGFFRRSTFLEGAAMSLNAHVREGTILEEYASGAHSAALKQTILFPFVTLGSLINFCDCLMAGGTSRKNHSEVGSSYIHFNFTPNHDKATASLLGDIPRGVMLNQPPIFLGGQGGLVGPCRLEYGAVVAAGSICRKDEFRPDRMILEGNGKSLNLPFYRGLHLTLKRIMVNNIVYIANLMALMQWYVHIRSQFVNHDFTSELYDGLRETLQIAIQERIARLMAYCRNLSVHGVPQTIQAHRQVEVFNNCSQMERLFLMKNDYSGDSLLREGFQEGVCRGIREKNKEYLAVIQGFSDKEREMGTKWLQGIVDHITEEALNIFPLLTATGVMK